MPPAVHDSHSKACPSWPVSLSAPPDKPNSSEDRFPDLEGDPARRRHCPRRSKVFENKTNQ